MKILVKSDVFDICNRIKKFDSTYYIVFDNMVNKYQVYSSNLNRSIELISGRVLSYVCTLPYESLDIRTIKYLYDTSVANLETLVKDIDEHNKSIERQNEDKTKSYALLTAENKLRQLT